MTCQQCSADTPDQLCWECLGKLRKILLDLREMIAELQLQVTRQSKGAPPVGRGGSGDPVLPFDVDASDTFDDLIKTLARWCA